MKVLIGFLSLMLSGAALANCPAGTTTVNSDTCRLEGKYTTDLQLTANKNWLLKGGVFVGGDNKDSATLKIQAGTVIKGETGRDYLVVSRGSKLLAEGTATRPIVFTSDRRIRGGWGGLVLNGNAPINGCATAPCEAEGEGNTGFYGGSDKEDSSGVLKYVRVEYAGYQISPENELNGLAFQGVGRGTVVENVQVHMGADDGMEFYGGTVDVRNIVITGARDDSLDWVNGWQGRGQYILIKQYDDEANNGIEADNFKANGAAEPRSNPELSNLTLIGSSSAAVKGGNAMLLRVGTGARIYNSVATGFKKACLDIDNSETFDADAIELKAVVFDCAKNFEIESGDAFDLAQWFSQAGNDNVEKAVKLKNYISGPALRTVTTTYVPMDLFFDEVDFVGAVRDEKSDWTKGWTVGL